MRVKFICSIIILLFSNKLLSQHKIYYDNITKIVDSYGETLIVSKEYLYSTPSKSKYVYNQLVDGKLEKYYIYATQEQEERAKKFNAVQNDNMNYDGFGSIFIKDFSISKIIGREYFPSNNQGFKIVNQELPYLKWVIVDEYKTIENYKCQKATIDYLGRKFFAWFTSEISIQDGPSVFYGLPGLIIEMQNEDNTKSYKLTKIEEINEEINFDLPENKVIESVELKDELDEYYKNLIKYKKSQFPDGQFTVSYDYILFPVLVYN